MSVDIIEGRVGGYTRTVTGNATVDTSTGYVSGDLVSTKLTFQSVGEFPASDQRSSGLIQSVIVHDNSAEAINMDVVFFGSDPSNTTFTDNSAFDCHDDDLPKILGVASITDWKSFNDNAVGQALNLAIPYDLGVATDIYAAMVARASATFVATDDISITVGILRD